MKLRRNLLWALLTAAIVVGAVLFALFYPGRSPELPAVTLPDTLPLLPEEDVEDFGSLTLADKAAVWKSQRVLTGLGTVSQNKRYLTLATPDGGSVALDIVTDVSITPDSATLNYLGQEA